MDKHAISYAKIDFSTFKFNTGPCEINHGGCDKNATCDQQTGQAICKCVPGFEGDGTTNGTGCVGERYTYIHICIYKYINA